MKSRSIRTTPDATPFIFLTNSGKRLDLVTQAMELAKANLPHRDAVEPSEVETAVEAEFEQRHDKLAQRIGKAIAHELECFAQSDRELPRPEDFDRYLEDAERDVQRLHLSESELEGLRQAQEAARKDLRRFTHGRSLPPARYPPSRWPAMRAVLLCVFGEALLNFAFFVPAVEYGYLQAFGLALATAGVTALAGLSAGFFGVRYLHAEQPWLRFGAGVSLVALSAGLVVFSLGVAGWRDLSAAGGEAGVHLSAALHSPFDLSMASLALLGLGLLASVFYLWKGALHFDDLVPGYSEVDRRFRRAERAYRDAVARLRRDSLDRIEAALSACEKLLERAGAHCARMEQALTRIAQLLAEYEQERRTLEDWARVLLLRFREINTLHRSTPPPSYFDQFPSLASVLKGPNFEGLTTCLKAALGRVRELYPRVQEVRGRIPHLLDATGKACDRLIDDRARRSSVGRADGSDHVPAGEVPS